MTRVIALCLVAIFLTSPALEAAWIREEIPAADITSLTFDPRTPGLVLAGSTSGQLYRSVDGGQNWRMPAGDLPFPGHVVAEIVVDPAIPGRFYAALWELWGHGGAVVRSDDAGSSWRKLPGLPDAQFRAVAVAPGAPYVIVAGGEEGVWQSTDGASTFHLLTPRNEEWSRVESLAIDPRTPLRLYAGTWRRAYRSDDGGRSWTTVWTGMFEDSDVFDLEIESQRPDEVWAATCGWVYQTADRGGAWQRREQGFVDRRVHDLARAGDDSLYAGTCGGLHRSVDQGTSWELTGFACETIAALAPDPAEPQSLLVAVEGDGVYRSRDAGRSWVRSSSGLAGAFVTEVVSDGAGGLEARLRLGRRDRVWSRPWLGSWRLTDQRSLNGTALDCRDISGSDLGPLPVPGLPARQRCYDPERREELVLTGSSGLYRRVNVERPASVSVGQAATR